MEENDGEGCADEICKEGEDWVNGGLEACSL